MQSPFNDNVGGGWGPGSLASGLLQYYNQVGQEGTSKLAGIAGGFIGGGIGGLSATPQPGEAQPSGLSRFMSGGVQGALGEANPEYKKLQAASKSADYFMKAGGDDAYAAMGIHPDEWKTLGARDKVAAVQGFMQQQGAQNQMEQVQALAQERRSKAAMYQMQQEEAQGLPLFFQELENGRQGQVDTNAMMNDKWQPGMPWTGGPPTTPFDPAPSMTGTGTSGAGPGQMGSPATGTTPGTPYSMDEMVHAAARMGATNPRLGTAVMHMLIPKLMNGDMSSAPQFVKSPEGNSFMFYHNTATIDPKRTDPTALMPPPEGYQIWVGPDGQAHLRPTPKPKELPASFQSTLDKVTTDITDAQGTLDAPDASFKLKGSDFKPEDIQALRAQAQKRLETAQKHGKATIDRYATGGYISPDEKADYYEQIGIEQPKADKGTNSGEPLPMPKQKSQLQGGKVYQTPRGKAKWNGTAFEPVS